MNNVVFTLDVTVMDIVIRVLILFFAVVTTIALIISKIREKIRLKKWEKEQKEIDNE